MSVISLYNNFWISNTYCCHRYHLSAAFEGTLELVLRPIWYYTVLSFQYISSFITLNDQPCLAYDLNRASQD